MKITSPITLRDRLLISVKRRRDSIEYMRFVILVKALLLDKTNGQSVSDFNDTIQKLSELETPGSHKKTKTPDDVKKIMQDFEIKFPKLKEKKLKNFKKVD